MSGRHFLLALSISAFSLLGQPAHALTTSTVSLTCSSTKKLQATIDSVASGTIATINVSGTCNENITVPRGKTIIIAGATATSKITAANNALPAVLSNGDTTIRKMAVSNASGTADAVVAADQGGVLQVVASDLSSPTTSTVLGIWGNSNAKVLNSRISGGADSAIDVWLGSTLNLIGNPSELSGPDGSSSVVSSSGGWAAIGCGVGSTTRIRAAKTSSASGSVLIKDSKSGVSADDCTLDIQNKTASVDNLKFTGMAVSSAAVNLNRSHANIANVSVSNNSGTGLTANVSSVQIQNSTFSGNLAGDVNSLQNATVVFANWSGPSTVSDAFVGQKIQCWREGRLWVDDGAIVIPADKTWTDLTVNNPSCF